MTAAEKQVQRTLAAQREELNKQLTSRSAQVDQLQKLTKDVDPTTEAGRAAIDQIDRLTGLNLSADVDRFLSDIQSQIDQRDRTFQINVGVANPEVLDDFISSRVDRITDAQKRLNEASQLDTQAANLRDQIDAFDITPRDSFGPIAREVEAVNAQIDRLGEASTITDRQLQKLAQRISNLHTAAGGDNLFFRNTGLLRQVGEFSDAFGRLQQLQGVLQERATIQIDDSQVQRLNQQLDNAIGKLNAIGVNRAHGGNIPRFANGGSQGTDTVMASLTPGEFVVNQKASQRFFSQLQAINAGVRPRFQDGGPATNIGDVTFNINESSTPQATAREVDSMLRRAARRGSIRG